MTTDHKPDRRPGGAEAADTLEALFRNVESRQPPPVEDEAAIRGVVQAEWRQVTRPANRRWLAAAAIAASVGLAVALVLVRGGAPSGHLPAASVAHVEKVIGTVQVRDGRAVRGTIGPDDAIAAGSRLTAGAGAGAAMRFTSGIVVRLAENSTAVLESVDRIQLVNGALYVDTGASTDAPADLAILTPHGVVRHVGTQYMARVLSSALRVSVRSGEIRVERAAAGRDEPLRAEAGERLSISSAGPVRVEPAHTWGPEWAWADALSGGFDADGRSLADLFDWVGEETGRRIVYENDQARQVAAEVVLRGDIEMEPLETLDVAAAASDLSVAVEDGEIRVSLRQP